MKLDFIKIDNKLFSNEDYRAYIVMKMDNSDIWEFRCGSSSLDETLKSVQNTINELLRIGENYDELTNYGYRISDGE